MPHLVIKSPVALTRRICLAGLVAVGAVSAQEPPAAQSDQTANTETIPLTTHAGAKHTNRLADETSPYLLQHAHNPVDWYPWGEEALAKAKAENKPIFLSVGYSACHWCHVMERESFENEDVAAVMNAHFVCIKVDREERPDIDEIYMTAVQAMTGSGGWPMSVWLTPNLKPFYGGTYYPPDSAYGRPGFKAVLQHIAKIWVERQDDVHKTAAEMTAHMESLLAGRIEGGGDLTPELLTAAADSLAGSFDATDGGFGDAPKFPSAPSIEMLLREHSRTGDESQLHMATFTLDKMALGGIYDHLGGGFARYSVDAQWLVPHFEKMLYDNAQLAIAYVDAWQVTRDPFYRRVVEETLDYILRDMTDEGGGFHCAEDADSEGEEGKFYLWAHDEILAELGNDDGAFFCDYYNIEPAGNFSSHEPYHRGKNILHMSVPMEAFAQAHGETPKKVLARLEPLRKRLLDLRSKRIRPGLDDKVLTAWNALMISAFCRAHQAFGEERYRAAAVRAAEFILAKMTNEKGELLRTHRKGESRLPAYLEDYSYFIVALVDLYETTFDVKYLKDAERLAGLMMTKFWDAEHRAFYFTSDDHTNLLVRTKPTYDGATPSGSSMAAVGLLRLAKLTDNKAHYDTAIALLKANFPYLSRAPRGYLKMLAAVDFVVYPPKEIAIVGPKSSPATASLLDALRTTYVPNKVVAFMEPSDESAGSVVPLLKGKSLVRGSPAAYVCKDFACKLPVTTPTELLEQLGVTPGAQSK